MERQQLVTVTLLVKIGQVVVKAVLWLDILTVLAVGTILLHGIQHMPAEVVAKKISEERVVTASSTALPIRSRFRLLALTYAI